LGVGLRAVDQDNLIKRQRAVSIATWDGPMEDAAQRVDLTKIQMVRAALELLAQARA
jgi:hypothetical protein